MTTDSAKSCKVPQIIHLGLLQMSARFCTVSWHLLPIFLGVTSSIGLFATYLLAKQNCHIEKWILPYVSYTGTENPESSIFGLILNTEGFLGILIVILVWRLVRHLQIRNELFWLNRITFVTGFFGCLGVIMVANFQVSRNRVPHYVGASLALIIGTLYCIFSSILTYKIRQRMAGFSTSVCILRIVTAGLMTICVITMTILGSQRNSFKRKYGKNNETGNLSSPFQYKYPNGSCIPIIDSIPIRIQHYDLTLAITEWILTVSLLFSLSLYAYEFRYFDNVKIVLKRGGDVLRSLDGRSDYISSLESQPLERNCYCSCNFVSCGPRENMQISAHGSEIGLTTTDGISSSELLKIKNNNTDSRCPQNFSSTDMQKVSKSMPDISKHLC